MSRVTIERLGHRGDGIATLDGKSVHVAKVLPGEEVELEGGRLSRVLKSSPERVPPFCKHYDACGGCKFQHWQDVSYGAWKRNLLVEALAAKGLTTQVTALIDAHGAGRRRVSLHVREIGGEWCAGFMEQKSHDLVALGECPVLAPEFSGVMEIAASFGVPLGPCDVAVTIADNGLDVAIKAERKAVPRRIQTLNELFRKHRLLRLSVNNEVHTALAVPVIRMGIADVPLPLQSFLQATKTGEDTLAALVLEGLRGAKRVADLFCGIGPFTFRLAEKARVSAYDSDRAAIACLQAAVRNTQGLKPIEAKALDLFRLPLVLNELSDFDGVVFDPPRAGAEAQSRLIAKSKVKRVVAVACDVGNFARDAAILVEGGYTLESVTPVDQFKWTGHLEMVGVFAR